MPGVSVAKIRNRLYRENPWRTVAILLCAAVCGSPLSANGQALSTPSAIPAASATSAGKVLQPAPENTSPPAAKVDVAPLAHDDEIQKRLARILDVAGLFENAKVTVKDGVVFLTGSTSVDANKAWAGDLARNTEDVVAVVNHIQVVNPSLWDFSPAIDSLKQMEFNLVRSLPLIASAVGILALAYGAAIVATRWMRRGLEHRVYAPLLREVFARCAGFVVLIIGLYITLRIANLTHLALTILGGTGLLGLVLGIAFGNITENFLASILLSMQQPFRVGDLVRIENTLGYVQRMTTRTTVITTVEGNEVQIPNATIYKALIRNFTTMPNSRVDFAFTVPRAMVDAAQERAMEVIVQHPVVLDEPEPAVLVDTIGDQTVTLRAYFWINGRENSWLKVRSSAMRLVLHAIDSATQASAPGKAGTKGRQGDGTSLPPGRRAATQAESTATAAVATKAEGKLATEADEIQGQAETRQGEGENLLSTDAGAAKAAANGSH